MSETDEDSELAAILAEAEEEGDELLVDLSDAVDFEPINGVRTVEVVGIKPGKSKNTPFHPYIELKLRVVSDEDKGRIVFRTCMLKGKGAGITKRTLTSLGADIDWEQPRISPAKLMGLTGDAVLAADDREEYKHKTIVKDMRPATTSHAADELPD